MGYRLKLVHEEARRVGFDQTERSGIWRLGLTFQTLQQVARAEYDDRDYGCHGRIKRVLLRVCGDFLDTVAGLIVIGMAAHDAFGKPEAKEIRRLGSRP